MILSDTLVALATPVGTSAVALIRASGPEAGLHAEALLGRSPTPRRAIHCDYRDVAGEVLDDVIITYYEGPKSYTGENSFEVSCHGNPFIARKILDDLLRRGCRMAEPGEFTRRAFTHGRIDLSQAEAVIDLINARSDRALQAANQQLRGSLGNRLNSLIERLLKVIAQIEAYIDFPDEDLPPENRGEALHALHQIQLETGRLLATHAYGDLLRDGIRTVILGEPNVGKSSLLNRLLGEERALVSPEPGTTRDFIEERLIIGPHCIRLIDTAGLNPSPAPLERLGMEKTLARADEADVFVVVLDRAKPFPALPDAVQSRLHLENTLIVLNKKDLPRLIVLPDTVDNKRVIELSAATGEGLEALLEAITAQAESLREDHGSELIAVNSRHADALSRSKASLSEALQKLEGAAPVDLLASDLRGALDALGEITGRIDNERMLDHLFANFCIGK